MGYVKVNAIIRKSSLEKVEDKLKRIGVKGITVTPVKGYGEYANFFSRNWKTNHSRIEIFTDENEAEKIAKMIMEGAHTGAKGDGLVALVPVAKVYRIRTITEPKLDEI